MIDLIQDPSTKLFCKFLKSKVFTFAKQLKKVREVRKLTRKEVALVSLDAHKTNGAPNWHSMKRRSGEKFIPSYEAVFQQQKKI